MPLEVTRRRFLCQALGVIGGTTVSGDLLPLLAEAAKRKQILRVAIERDFETLRPDIGVGDTFNMLRRLMYTTPIIWGAKQRPDGSLIYDPETIEMVLATAYKVSDDRQMIEFTLRNNAKFANGDPINAQALKDSYAWFLGAKGSGQLKVNGLPSAEHIEVVDDVTLRLHLDRPVAWGLIGNALMSSSSIIHAKEILKHATADDPFGTKWSETKAIESGPFVIETWQKGAMMSLVPNPHAFQPSALERIILQVVPDASTRLMVLEHGRPAQGPWRQGGLVPECSGVVFGDDVAQGPIQQYALPPRHGVGDALRNADAGRHAWAVRAVTQLCAEEYQWVCGGFLAL